MPRHTISTMIGKLVKQVARLRGSGSALPGLVVERMDRGYLRRTLEPLPGGVVLVSGTNGKTTTTKVVTELLQAVGYKVFTNRTGSNFSRGVISELLPLVTWRGKLDADIAVLELDEAWAVHFVRQVKPRMSLFLNVMRDQLDRFGEIDTAAEMLAKNAEAATEAVILNRDDPRVYRIRERAKAEAVYFGTTDELLALMPTDDTLKGGQARANHEAHADVLLTAIDGRRATHEVDGAEMELLVVLGDSLKLEGAVVIHMSSPGLRASSRMVRISSSSMSASRAAATPSAKWVSTSRSTCSRTSSASRGRTKYPFPGTLATSPSGKSRSAQSCLRTGSHVYMATALWKARNGRIRPP